MRAKQAKTSARGYGAKHQALRKRAQAELDSFRRVPCVRCGDSIVTPDYTSFPQGHVKACRSDRCGGECWSTWELDHTDDRTGYLGHAHRACNRAAGGGGHVSRATRPMVSWEW